MNKLATAVGVFGLTVWTVAFVTISLGIIVCGNSVCSLLNGKPK